MSDQPLVYQYGTKPGIQRDGTNLDANLYNDGQWVRFVRAAGRPKKMGGYRAISQYMTGPVRGLYVWSRQFLNAIYSFSSTKVEVLSADQNGVGSSIVDRTPRTITLTLTPVSGTILQGQSITGGTSLATGIIAKLSGTTATLCYVTGTWQNAETATSNLGATATTGSYTNTAFTGGADYNWQIESMFDAAANSGKSIIIAHASPNLAAIDDGTLCPIFVGDISDFTKPLEAIGQFVSGGVVVAPPYLITYGSDGQVTWSNENEPLNIYSGAATTTRVTASKIVKGLPLRSGQGTSVLLWSLDSVIRLAWVGGTAIFRIDTLSSQSSILSSSSVIEYDGVYFWAGIDRFLTYNGTVREVPNTVNLQWFFDNLNFDQRQKVRAMKVPKYGEVWWLFPFGDSTECNKAIIYNVRLDTWYDTDLDRSCGYYSQVFKYPVMADSLAEQATVAIVLTGITGTYTVGDTVTGSVSLATGRIIRIQESTIYLLDVSGTFAAGDTVAGSVSGSGTFSSMSDIDLFAIWTHEAGVNKVAGDNETAIRSYFETSDFGYPTGSVTEAQAGPDRWTRLSRVEPDFVQTGDMTCVVSGREFARSTAKESAPYTFTSTTQKIDMREQRREIRLRFESNVAGGDYEAGKVLLHIEMGDVRN
jgi:hypothetical protein